MNVVAKEPHPSEFQLDGDCYVLVAACTTAGLSLPNDLQGDMGVGHCEILGRTYTVVKCDCTGKTREELTDLLTERELEIATLVALGRPNKQIADKLHISEWTVSTHLRRIFAKLRVHSRAAMVYRCVALLGPAGGSVRDHLTRLYLIVGTYITAERVWICLT